MSAQSLKAFAVTDKDEGSGGVVFAKTNVEARRVGAAEFGDGDFAAFDCRRAPEFDRWASRGAVPLLALYEAGWWQECVGCERRIQQDWDDEPLNPRETPRGLYCTPACKRWDDEERAKRERHEARALRAMERSLLRRLPAAEIVRDKSDAMHRAHAYVRRDQFGRWRIHQAVVAFRFPGAQHGLASFRADDRHSTHFDRKPPGLYVPAGDRAVFDAWRNAA